MRPISFAVVITDGFAPGESEDVLRLAVEVVYRPLVQLLKKTPSVKVGMTISGPLAEWLEFEDLEFTERLGELVAKRQVEILATPHFGALPHVVPSRDAVDHLKQNIGWVKEFTGAKPRGAWLVGEGWDSTYPRVLARAGLQYTLCAEELIQAAGQQSPRGPGWFVADREGAATGIIPIDRRMRLFMPWGEPKVVAAELQNRARAGDRVLASTLSVTQLGMQDGQRDKFWHERAGWMIRTFKMLAGQSSWLKSILCKDILKTNRPAGRVAPISGTAIDVGKTALPPPQGVRMNRLLGIVQKGADPVLMDAAPWLVGPPWESFLSRREEANRLHKRMLRVVFRLAQARRKYLRDKKAAATLAELGSELLRAQSAAVCFDGMDGGIYRGDLRHAAWAKLVEVEQALIELDGEQDAMSHRTGDFDCDGQQEVTVTTPTFGAVVTPAQGGAITELVVWGSGNILNTMTRYPEIWHADLERSSSMPMLVGPEGDDEEDAVIIEDPEEEEVDAESTEELGRPPISGQPVALPERTQLKSVSPGLDRLLHHDRHCRASFIEHLFGEPLTLDNLWRGQAPEIGDFVGDAYQLQSAQEVSINETRVTVAREGTVLQGDHKRLLRVYKQYRFYSDLPEVDVELVVSNRYHEPIRATLGVEINLNLDSVRGDDRFLMVPGRERIFLDKAGELEDVGEVGLVMADRGLQVALKSDQPARLFHFPIETPVRTWRGYDAAFQGTCLMFCWNLELWGQEKQAFALSLKTDEL